MSPRPLGIGLWRLHGTSPPKSLANSLKSQNHRVDISNIRVSDILNKLDSGQNRPHQIQFCAVFRIAGHVYPCPDLRNVRPDLGSGTLVLGGWHLMLLRLDGICVLV
jgi:hypothetical protein